MMEELSQQLVYSICFSVSVNLSTEETHSKMLCLSISSPRLPPFDQNPVSLSKKFETMLKQENPISQNFMQMSLVKELVNRIAAGYIAYAK